MKTKTSALSLIFGSVLLSGPIGCIVPGEPVAVVGPPPPPGFVVVEDGGYRHEGYYDRDHYWHGYYYDERHVRHDDDRDWHHDRR